MFFRRGLIISLPIAAILLFPLFSGKSHAGDSAVNSALEAAKSQVELSGEAPAAEKNNIPAVEKNNAPAVEKNNRDTEGAKTVDQENSAPDNDSESEGFEQANYAGVENKRLLRGGNGEPHVSLWYPALGNKEVDASLKRFAEAEVRAYADEVADSSGDGEDKPSSYSMWDLSGIFFIERPSSRVVSVTFNIYKYSGGAHGNISIDCLNYDLANGRHLGLADLFREPEKALRLMSVLTAQKLLQSLGEEADDEMIAEGTAPLPENFNNLTLVPKGLFVEFQPYQVGPWSIGPQRVQLGLDELAPAGPSPEVWNIAGDNPGDSAVK